MPYQGGSMNEEVDYEVDVSIDESALDVEWLHQAEKFMTYSRLLAQADRKTRSLEERIKVLRAHIVLDSSGKSSLGKGQKPTGQVIEAIYRDNKEHRELKRRLNAAQYKADIYRSAVFAFQQRKTALENLVILHGQNYFAGPNVPRNLTKEEIINRKREEANKKVRDKINKGGN